MNDQICYKIIISYDGTAYSGWQVQPDRNSIQMVIQKALEKILQKKTFLTGAGRTDSGVHAIAQVAHFYANTEFTLSTLQKALNAILPNDIRINSIEKAQKNFHARYSAIGKTYHYHVSQDPVISPFLRYYRYQCLYKLDLELIKEAAKHFIGTHDFTSFVNKANSGPAAKNAIRTINSLEIKTEVNGFRIEFKANGFLYKMVRNISGTLIDIGRGKIPLKNLKEIFLAKDRKKSGAALPSHGLFLVKVHYENTSNSSGISQNDS